MKPKTMDITLGAHKYKVEEQPAPYLEMELELFRDTLRGGVSSGEDLADLVIEQDGTPATLPPGRRGFGQVAGPAYDVLLVFIPDLMPEWEFRGFANKEAFEAGVRDRESARLGPTFPQIKRAFEAAFLVNEIDAVKHLGKFLPKGLLESYIQHAVGAQVSELFSSSLSAAGA